MWLTFLLFTVLSSSIFANEQQLPPQFDCQAPNCTLTTTTITDIFTVASVVNLTTTITVSQALHLKCSNSTTTETFSTSTCTSCHPTKNIDRCGFSNGGFTVLFEPKTFLEQVAACRQLDMDLAELSFENFPVAMQVARRCLGQQRLAYIKSYEGEAKPCLAVSTGEGKHANGSVEIVCCTQLYPAICQAKQTPPECAYDPECDACRHRQPPHQPPVPRLK